MYNGFIAITFSSVIKSYNYCLDRVPDGGNYEGASHEIRFTA